MQKKNEENTPEKDQVQEKYTVVTVGMRLIQRVPLCRKNPYRS